MDSLLWTVAGVAFPPVKHPLDIVCKHLPPRCRSTSPLDSFDRFSSIGEGEDTQHQRRGCQLLENWVIPKHHTHHLQLFTRTRQIRVDLLCTKRLHHNSIAELQLQMWYLCSVIRLTTTYDSRN